MREKHSETKNPSNLTEKCKDSCSTVEQTKYQNNFNKPISGI